MPKFTQGNWKAQLRADNSIFIATEKDTIAEIFQGKDRVSMEANARLIENSKSLFYAICIMALQYKAHYLFEVISEIVGYEVTIKNIPVVIANIKL